MLKTPAYTRFESIPVAPITNRYSVIQPLALCDGSTVYKTMSAQNNSYISYDRLKQHTYEPYNLMNITQEELEKPKNKLKCNCGL